MMTVEVGQTASTNLDEESKQSFFLHSYYRSSCSARLRIACHLKGISLQCNYVNLLNGDQRSPEYIAVNPSGQVPTLLHILDSDTRISITQSVAALEYLEEIPSPESCPLLPPLSRPMDRAQVRILVNIIACDTQPVTNLRILQRVKHLATLDPDGIAVQWARDLMTDGLQAYEKQVQKSAGTYSVGESVTLADVCLVPAIWGAIRFGVELEKMPTLMGIYQRMSDLEAVKSAHWKCQPDTPQNLR